MNRLLLLSLGIVGCASEETVKVFNTEPTASISSHSGGEEILEGAEIVFQGLVSDANHENNTLSVRWSTNLRDVCTGTVPNIDGSTQCQMTLQEGETQVLLQVSDPEGGGGIASVDITLILNASPTVSILSPSQENSYYSDQLIHFSALLNDSEDSPEEIQYEWESSIDGILPITSSVDGDGSMEAYVFLSEGQHALSLKAIDTSGKSTTESLALQVYGVNHDPECSITQPSDEDVVVSGQSILFRGEATDEDINNSLISVIWSSDLDGVINTTNPDSAGGLSFGYADLSPGSHNIRLEAEDETGGLCSTGIILYVGTPPSLTITDPSNGAVYTQGEAVVFQGLVTDQEDLASDITMQWESSLDGVFSNVGSDSSGNISFTFNSLSPGLHNITATAQDSSGLTALSSFGLYINTPPEVNDIELSPNPAFGGDSITASVVGSVDVDGDPISFDYAWRKNGSLTSHTTSVIASSLTMAGEVWSVEVTPNDGFVDGVMVSADLIIQNTAPEVTSIQISPSSAYNDEMITCVASVFDPDETLIPSYTWTVAGVDYIGDTLDLSTTMAMPESEIICTVSVTDHAGESAEDTATLILSNRQPTLSNSSISPSIAYSNSELTCISTASDDDGEVLATSYAWSVGGVNIATGETLELNSTMVSVGDSIACTIDVEDGYGGVSSDSVTTVIENTEPILDSLSLSSTQPSKQETIVCSAAASDTDEDALIYTFLWSNQATQVVYPATLCTHDTSTLDISSLSVQSLDVIVCSVVVEDIHGGTVSDSVTAEVINTAPVFDVPTSITPDVQVYTNTELVCSATVLDSDDGSLSASYSWSVGSIVVGAGSTYTVSAADTDVGDTLICMATAIDSDGETSTSTASVEIENTGPTISGVQISSSSSAVYNDATLTCSGVVSDPDESIVPQYEWKLNSVIVGTISELDLRTTSALPGDAIVCTISGTDTQGLSGADTSTVSVENRAPSTPSLSISPSNPEPNVDDLMCSIDVSSIDLDGETVQYAYSWTVGGLSTSYITDTIPNTDISYGDEWICMVTPSDATEDGVFASASVSVEDEYFDVSNDVINLDNGIYIKCFEGLTVTTTSVDCQKPLFNSMTYSTTQDSNIMLGLHNSGSQYEAGHSYILDEIGVYVGYDGSRSVEMNEGGSDNMWSGTGSHTNEHCYINGQVLNWKTTTACNNGFGGGSNVLSSFQLYK